MINTPSLLATHPCPSAKSPFTESLIPLRALHLHAQKCFDDRSATAAAEAGEFFLRHRLSRRLRDGSVINPAFVQLHYPCYWHYDILFALTVFTETGQIRDKRCTEPLELLERKRLPDGGFPAETAITDPPAPWCRASAPWSIGVVSAAAAPTSGYRPEPPWSCKPRGTQWILLRRRSRYAQDPEQPPSCWHSLPAVIMGPGEHGVDHEAVEAIRLLKARIMR